MKGGEVMLKMERKTCRYTGNGTMGCGCCNIGNILLGKEGSRKAGAGAGAGEKEEGTVAQLLAGWIHWLYWATADCLVWLGERSPVSARFRNVSRALWMRPDGV
jgi:hypothetical protein